MCSGINKHNFVDFFKDYDRIALALWAHMTLFIFEKNSLTVLIYSKLHSKSCNYLYKLHNMKFNYHFITSI